MAFIGICVSVCLLHNSKTNDPKMFKLGVGNKLGISEKWYGFGFGRLKVEVKKCKNVFQAVELPAWVCTSFECPSSSYDVCDYGRQAVAAAVVAAADLSPFYACKYLCFDDCTSSWFYVVNAVVWPAAAMPARLHRVHVIWVVCSVRSYILANAKMAQVACFNSCWQVRSYLTVNYNGRFKSQ